MTRCYKSSSTLKSSVFNHTGQPFIDQVEVQRTLCAHFRRILSAKSVVDSRNPRYIKMIQRKTRPATAKKFLLKCPSDETIEKLAYDTEHHPCDLVRVQCRSKSTSHDRSWSGDRQRPINNDANYPRPKAHTSRDRSSDGKWHGKNQKRPANTSGSKHRPKDKCGSTTSRSARSKGCKYDEEQRSEYQLPESGLWRFEEQCCQSEEEARYARFVYDITQEIVQNGLYTDCELKEVFEKHLNRNAGHLSRRKMLYEIYQLKISLNMMDDTDEEDEVETDMMFAEKFSTHRIPKPPTPPKILNENKVIEKLESFKQFESCRHLARSLADTIAVSTPCRKSVTLVDANPEFLVTERDVLSSLADNHVEPHQIERICRNLYQRSKDMTLCEAVQVGSEVAYTYRLKQVDRCTSAASLSDICYSKKESRGILRKDCGTSNKSLSPMSFRKFGFAKRYDGNEKCARWAIGECDCEEQPCKEHRQPPERLRKSSATKIDDNSTKEQTSKAQQAGSPACDCESKRNYAANVEASPSPKKCSSLRKPTEKSVCYIDQKISEKIEYSHCDCEALPCSEHPVPPLKLKRKSATSVSNEDEKWKKEDSTELTHAEKEDAQKVPLKSSKLSDEEKSQLSKSGKRSSEEKDQSRRSSRISEQEKDQSRKSSKLSVLERDQSQRSSKLSEKQEQSRRSSKMSARGKGQSRKSSKSSEENKNLTEKPNKIPDKEVDKVPLVEPISPKGERVRSGSKTARRSSSDSSLSDVQPAQKTSKTRKQKPNFSFPNTPVVMRSRLPSEHNTEERISTESSEISSESDELTVSAMTTRRHSPLSAIESKGSVEAMEGDDEDNGFISPLKSPMKSRRVSLTTSPDTSNRTSGDFDLEYTKFDPPSNETQKDLNDLPESASRAPQERKKDVPKDRMPTKALLVSKTSPKISDRSDSSSNRNTLSETEHKRPATKALSRVLINVLDSPKSPRISEQFASLSNPLQEDILIKKLERIQSEGDVEKMSKARQFKNRKSSVLFLSDVHSPKKKDDTYDRHPASRKSILSSTNRSRRSSSASEKFLTEKKQVSEGNEESSENEEIEEEIDTASETTARSPREPMKKEAEKEAEKKRQMLAREVAKALEEEEDEDEEERYSDDFSDVSDSPRKSEEARKHRVSSVRDFLESFAESNEPRAPYVSSGSSSSGRGSPSLLSLNLPSGSLDETARSTPIVKKRTSSGISGYRVMESWNERLSEISSDFYVNRVARYCDPQCRSSVIAKTCSSKCKFAKTNCAHIKEPTDCMRSDDETSAADASTQESTT